MLTNYTINMFEIGIHVIKSVQNSKKFYPFDKEHHNSFLITLLTPEILYKKLLSGVKMMRVVKNGNAP